MKAPSSRFGRRMQFLQRLKSILQNSDPRVGFQSVVFPEFPNRRCSLRIGAGCSNANTLHETRSTPC
jgi:hypothetical protein